MVFPSELLKLPHLSPQIGNMRKYSSSRANPIRVRTLPRQYTNLYWASSQSQYEKILQAHGANTRYYWLVEVIKNDCIVTQVRVYDEISPEPSGNPLGFALGISLGLRRYLILYPPSCHSTVKIYWNSFFMIRSFFQLFKELKRWFQISIKIAW